MGRFHAGILHLFSEPDPGRPPETLSNESPVICYLQLLISSYKALNEVIVDRVGMSYVLQSTSPVSNGEAGIP